MNEINTEDQLISKGFESYLSSIEVFNNSVADSKKYRNKNSRKNQPKTINILDHKVE